jgi:hypothetical protein
MKYLPRRRSLFQAQEYTRQAKFNPRMNIVGLGRKYTKNIYKKRVPGKAPNLKKQLFLYIMFNFQCWWGLPEAREQSVSIQLLRQNPIKYNRQVIPRMQLAAVRLLGEKLFYHLPSSGT